MERHRRLDIVGYSTAGTLILLTFFLLLILPACLGAQAADCPPVKKQEVKKLYDAGRWEAVIRAIPGSCREPADLELDRGLALAQLGRLPAAKEAFRSGLAQNPRDVRFLVELAGVAYREKDFSQAKVNLRRAIAFDPHNAYAENFLASIYYLEGNLGAALKYWNRVGKPKLVDLTFQVPPGLDPLILDRAFEFSRGSEWRRDQFLTTRTRLQSLNLFPRMHFDLQARPNGSFDLVFDDTERSRWDGLEGMASMLRGLPYQSVYPEFYNLNHKGLNWLSLMRWDDQKRRLFSEVSAPLPEGPQKRFKFYVDARNENWNITHTLRTTSPSRAGMNMRVAVAGAEIWSIPSWRWQWSLGGEYSYRTFRSLTGIPAQADAFFTNTSGLALRTELRRSLIRFPERRFTLNSNATVTLGKFFSRPLGRYGQVMGSLAANWLPQAQGDDYETKSLLRAGRTLGQVPFDDLSMLGFDRDNPLWMRGHDALIHGQKGNAPLGRNFILSNSSFAKVLYRDPFVQIKFGPFLDTGDIYDPSGFFGSPKWLTDTGLQATVGIFGRFQFVVGYGKNLRSGENTFYTTVLQ